MVVSLKKLCILAVAVLAREIAFKYCSSSIALSGVVLIICVHSETTFPFALTWKDEIAFAFGSSSERFPFSC